MNLPRKDFPAFDGNDPEDWLDNCEYYFDMFQISEDYKTRLAAMNFSGNAYERYRCFK